MSKTDDKTKWMQFLIEDDDLFKKYSDIWNNVSNIITKKTYLQKNNNNKKKIKMKN